MSTFDQVVKSIIKPGPKKEKNKKKRNLGPVNTKDHDEAQKAEDHDLPRPSVGLQITRVLFVLAAYFWSFAAWGLRALAKCFSAINDVTYNRTRQIVAGKEGEIVKVEEEQRGASGLKAANYAKVCGPLPQPLSVHCHTTSFCFLILHVFDFPSHLLAIPKYTYDDLYKINNPDHAFLAAGVLDRIIPFDCLPTGGTYGTLREISNAHYVLDLDFFSKTVRPFVAFAAALLVRKLEGFLF